MIATRYSPFSLINGTFFLVGVSFFLLQVAEAFKPMVYKDAITSDSPFNDTEVLFNSSTFSEVSSLGPAITSEEDYVEFKVRRKRINFLISPFKTDKTFLIFIKSCCCSEENCNYSYDLTSFPVREGDVRWAYSLLALVIRGAG